MNNIPRIGDKIINNKIVRTETPPPPKGIPNNTEETAAKIDTTLAQTATKEEEEKEYSIKQFRKDYKHILIREVFPKLKPFEEKRQKYCKNLNIGLYILVILSILYIALAVMFNFSIEIGVFVFLGVAYTGIRHFFKKKLENEIKNQVMPMLMKAIPGFNWSLNEIISQTETERADLFPYDSRTNVSSDDNFEGTYRNVGIAITESKYSYETGSGKSRHTVVVFSGAIARIKMNKKFEGMTIIRPKNKTSLAHKLEEVKLEDVDFHKYFKVYSTDQIESRYLLTTSFIERFKDIMNAFNTDKIYCSFYEDYVYIAPWSNKDLFSLAHLSKTLIDEEQYDVLFAEFASILALVDHFKLDKKLGL